jgi:hypothetical protein
VDRHQQQSSIPAADPGRPFRRTQNHVDLVRLEVFDQFPLISLAEENWKNITMRKYDVPSDHSEASEPSIFD